MLTLRFLTTTRACHKESFILYFYSEIARINLFLGYFVHIVPRERDGIIAKDLLYARANFYFEVKFSSIDISSVVGLS